MKLSRILLLAILVFITSPACKKDECENTHCLHGGVCVNGNCNCPTGYEGPSCESQVTPTRMQILSISLIRFPASDNGTEWDTGDGPDLYIQLLDGTQVIYEQPNAFVNADPGQQYELTLSPPIDITNCTGEHIIRLFDKDDPDDDDFMGGIVFTPYYSSTNAFTPIIPLDAGGTAAFVLGVRYEW